MTTIHDFVLQQRQLLELELKSEEEEERSIASSVRTATVPGREEGASHVLRNLEACDVSVGLYGRTVITLTAMSGTMPSADVAQSTDNALLLPSHRFTVGDEVEIHSKQKSSMGGNAGGVVCAVSETSISVALFSKRNSSHQNEGDNNDEEEDIVGTPPLSVIPKSSVEVHRKLVRSLGDLEKYGAEHPIAGRIVQALFEPDLTNRPSAASLAPIQPFNTNLDSSQLEAIAFALGNEDLPVASIHGPPGTGKTTTIAEVIHQAVHIHHMKVLVTAPSNVAVDNVLERLVAGQSPTKAKRSRRRDTTRRNKLRAVRLGHPARIKEAILPYSLESLVQNADGTEIVSDVRRELQSFLRIANNPKSRAADKRAAYREVRALRKEVRSREEKVVKELLTNAQVVLTTNVGAANRILDRIEDGFELVIIDEAAQALEASCWIPILRGKRLILAGDHCQLPPTIKSPSQEVQRALGRTLFERTIDLYGGNNPKQSNGSRVCRMLKVQYRMHEKIADWASGAMYRGQLQTSDSVRSRILSQLEHVEAQSINGGTEGVGIADSPLLLIDTSGCGMHESTNAAGSRYNDGEAQIVAFHVRTLLQMGVKPEEVAVISPYNGQVELLRTMLLPDIPKLEIRSVDGFQGGEREAVVLSLVRSSERGGADGIGFLKDDRRLNVAVTRAKRHVALICDCETVSQSDFIKGLVSWMEERGEHRSAIEFLSSDSDHIEQDVKDAEMELLRLIDDTTGANVTKNTEVSTHSSPSNIKNASSGTDSKSRPKDDERLKAILDKIAAFAETSSKGDELAFGSELSKFDRKVVHEFASQIGLGHRSEGVEGVNRRIIVSNENEPPIEETANKELQEQKTSETDGEDTPSQEAIFAALANDSDSSSESEHEADNVVSVTAKTTPSDMNQLLASLAQERLQRQKQPEAEMKAPILKGKGKKKKKPKKKQPKHTTKSGGSTLDGKGDYMGEDMDDMAFLDAQIEQVQTSHGRKVEGKGKDYRSIVNGILLAKPTARTAPKNERASSLLNAKSKQAQDGRKAKKGGKKKK